jgi:hypothetical protein
MLHQLYVLRPPDEPPTVPSHWSWSSLSEWRDCPRRWWLLRAKYSFASNGRYPIRISADSLRGQIVHDALETSRTATPPFDAYRYMRRRLAEKLRELGALTKGLDLTAAGVKFDPVKEDRRWRSPF